MEDGFLRAIDYARISVTDGCNFGCHYCKVPEECEASSLSGNQLKTLVDALDKLKFRKLRFTGGEPLLNANLVEVISYANNKPHIKDIGLTTNGLLLDRYLDQLVDAGLKRINISLDSLKKERFHQITKVDKLEKVLENIVLARAKDLIVKVNVVLMKGINDDEIDDFLAFGRTNDVQFRFIELMKIGKNGGYVKDKQFDLTAHFKDYEKQAKRPGCKDVSDYYMDEFGYIFGIISPLSNHFCATCNRIRFTSDGKLRLCLHGNHEIDMTPYLTDADALAMVIMKSVNAKPDKHRMNEGEVSKRAMNRIGG